MSSQTGVRGMLVARDPTKVTSKRVLTEGEIIEREVFVNTSFTLKPGSRIRYCTLGNCQTPKEDQEGDGDAYIEHCIISGETDLASLWESATRCDNAGHLAPDHT